MEVDQVDMTNTMRWSDNNDLDICFSESLNLEAPRDPNTVNHFEGFYHDYYLAVTGNVQISQAFYDNIEVISLASNVMTLLSLPELSVQFDTPIYRIN